MHSVKSERRRKEINHCRTSVKIHSDISAFLSSLPTVWKQNNKSWMNNMILFITYLEILYILFTRIKTSDNTNAHINFNKRIKCTVPVLSEQKVVKLF